jgi:hypothetical protein
MNGSIFWRLVWKEYRLQRAFWISMAVLTVLIELLVLSFVRPGPERVTWLFAIGLGLPAFYALGCGATLFATEHETGTYEFQRALPVSALRLFGGKLVFAVVSTVLLLGLLWSSTTILAGWQVPRAQDHLVLWGLWGMAAVELLLWGIFFSLFCQRPMLAAVLAVAAGSMSVHLAAGGPAPHLGGEPYLAAVPFRVMIAALLTVADIWLGSRWLRERILGPRTLGRFRFQETLQDEAGEVPLGMLPRRVAVLGRLVWQQWRQSARMMAGIGALLVPVLLAGTWVWTTPADIHRNRLSATILLASLVASLLGSCVFLADQQHRQFRFLAEQGVRPRYVWLSRQLVWIIPLLLLTAAVLPLPLFGNDELLSAWQRDIVKPWERGILEPWERFAFQDVAILIGYASQVAVLLACIALAYASGQLCSMLLRSGILAAVFGLLLTTILYGWAWLMLALEVSLIWSLAPIPLVLMLVTWLRAPHWILERNTLRSWLLPGVALIVPGSALLAAVPLYRVYQIPDVPPGFSPEEYARPITAAERATVQMYQRAYDAYVPYKYDQPAKTEAARLEREIAWLKENEPAIAVTLKASRREDCDFFDLDANAHEQKTERACDLGNLLLRSARRLDAEGKPDAALERYLAALRVSIHLRRRALWPFDADALEGSVYDCLPRWASHADQTPERIRGLILELDTLNKRLPPREDAIKSQYLLMRRIIAADPEALTYIGTSKDRIFKTMLWKRLLPWEEYRARRVLNVRTARDLERWSVRDNVRYGAHVPYPRRRAVSQKPSYPFFLATGKVSQFLENHRSDDLAWGLTQIETRRRAVRLLLALQGWKREHGELPKTLDQLVGPYLEHLPLDPYSREPFRFFREGLPIPLKHQYWSWLPYRLQTAEPGTPLIWSAGPNVYVRETELAEGEDEYLRYWIEDSRSDASRPPTSEYDLWASGWWFSLP